jgi:hypothetical protein
MTESQALLTIAIGFLSLFASLLIGFGITESNEARAIARP